MIPSNRKFYLFASGPRPVTLFSHAVDSECGVLLAVPMQIDPTADAAVLRDAARQAPREPVEEARQHSVVRV